MYSLGETPLILQGAAQREVLSPEQTLRVQQLIVNSGGTLPYTPPPTSGLMGASVMGVPLWLLGVAAAGIAIARR